MTKYIIAILLISVFAIKNYAQTTQPEKPYIEITTKAEKEIEPDMIYLSIVVSEKDNKGKASITSLEAAMFAKLKNLGIDIKNDLKVKELSSKFKDRGIFSPDIVLSKSYQLLVKDSKTATLATAALEEAGISNIAIEKITHSALEQLKKETRILAIRSARENASAMAVELGQELGKAIAVQEHYCHLVSPQTSNRGIMKAAFDNFESQEQDAIDFEKIKIDCQILVRFELK